MSGRMLKVALGVSLALNLFAVAGGVALYTTRAKVDRQVEAQAKPGRGISVMAKTESLAPAERDRVRAALRTAAHAAKPDFEAARAARREAVTRAAAAEYDPVAIQSLLEQSRLAEMRGRARLESDALAVLGSMSAADRAAMAPMLARRSSRGPGPRRPEAPPPAR